MEDNNEYTYDEGTQNPLWKVFGRQQRAFRELRGRTQEQLSQRSGYSLGQVRGVELGTRRATEKYVTHVDAALDAQGLLLAAAQDLVADRHPGWFEKYAKTEAEVRRLYTYDTHVLNGLLQTEEYARSLLSTRVPVLDDEEVENKVQGRISRQALLTRKPPPTLGFVIEQVVLEHPIGGKVAFKRQLEHLAACARMRNVQIQVMATNQEKHVGLDGPMTLLETAEGRSLGYVEVQGVSRFIVEPKRVSDLEQRYGIIRSQALSPEESLSYIEDLAGAL